MRQLLGKRAKEMNGGGAFLRHPTPIFLITQPTLHSKLTQEFPNHPLVKDVSEKADLFDEAAAKFSIPSLPTVAV